MAFGFIKKIFSFGKKQVEEVPAGAQPQDETARLPEPETATTEVIADLEREIAAATEALAPFEYGAFENQQNRAMQAAGMMPGMEQAAYLPEQMRMQVGVTSNKKD